MSMENPLIKSLLWGKIDEARTLLQNGEPFPSYLDEYDKNYIIHNVLQAKAFDLFELLISNGYIQMDVYDCDDLNSSTFRLIASGLKDDNESAVFFANFIQRVSNINDEIDDQTLLGLFLDREAGLAVIKSLADAGCNVHYKNNAEQSYIHLLIKHPFLYGKNGKEYLQYFVNEGVDIHTADLNGKRPLDIAVQHRYLDYITILMENGADPNEQNTNGENAFFAAITDRQVFALLISYTPPDFSLRTQFDEDLLCYFMRRCTYWASEDTLSVLEMLLKAGADPYQPLPHYNKQKSALDWAAEKSELVLKTFLEVGDIDISRQDDKGNTVLHKVCAYNIDLEKEKAKETYKKVKLLIEKGADVNALNDCNETPLMFAVEDSLKIKTVELLMQNGAKAN